MKLFILFIFRNALFKRTTGLVVLFSLVAFSSEAQLVPQPVNSLTGKINGRVIDSVSGQPVQYATIGLVTQSNNRMVNGSTSDDIGTFKLSNLPEGTYKLMVDFIGYKVYEKKNIVVGKGNWNISLGDIKLVNKQITMNEVTIKTEKSYIENKIDKMVFNAGKDITSQGGVAVDVLKKIPQVSVDVDGNVELQGNSSIRFLIDGKPSVLFGSNITDVLQSIPASQIESIEVITSPGAKYDAEGTGGIINIILKKNNVRGINGNISLSGGTRLENGSFNLNVRQGKFGAHAYFSGNAQLLSTTLNSSDRKTTDTSTISHLIQNGSSDFSRYGCQSGVGFDWDLTPKDNINGAFGFNYFGNQNSGSANRETNLQDISGNQLSDVNDMVGTKSNFHQYAYDCNLGYKRKFNKKDQELEILFNYSNGNMYSYYEQTQSYLKPDSIYSSSYGNNPGIQNETNITVNYAQPFKNYLVFEIGAKTVVDHIVSTSNVYLLDIPTNNFDFNETQSSSVDFMRYIYAGYISATFKVFKLLDVKPGLRDEYTESNADFSNSGIITMNPYNTVVPSLIISHTFKKNQTLKISYSHRIARPNYRDMNPFINASDPKNISTGNPNLLPETGDKVELSYNQTFTKGTAISTTLFYRGNKNDIQSYTTYYPTYKVGDSTYTNVAVSMRENIGREDNFGLNLYASLPATEKISLRTNISGFEREITTGLPSGGDNSGFMYRANLNASYQVSSSLIIELSGNYNSSGVNAQGTFPSFTTYNFAFRKQLFHKNGSIAITATNFFDKYITQQTELTGDNFAISNTRQLPFRSFGFNFTYKFGKMEFKPEKGDEDNMNNQQE